MLQIPTSRCDETCAIWPSTLKETEAGVELVLPTSQRGSETNSERNEKMSLVTEEIRARAERYTGDELCQVKSKELLKEMGLPNGLLPLHDIEECGYVKETGFVWLRQKKSVTHKFEKIGKLVSYATEVTAVVEPTKIKKLTGVKSKELLLWITLSDIYLDSPSGKSIAFQTPAGLRRSFPVSAFEIDEPEQEVVKSSDEVADGAVQVNEI